MAMDGETFRAVGIRFEEAPDCRRERTRVLRPVVRRCELSQRDEVDSFLAKPALSDFSVRDDRQRYRGSRNFWTPVAICWTRS